MVNIAAVVPQRLPAIYSGSQLTLRMPQEGDNDLSVGIVTLTRSGKELAGIAGSRPVSGFWEYVRDRWNEYLPNPSIRKGQSNYHYSSRKATSPHQHVVLTGSDAAKDWSSTSDHSYSKRHAELIASGKLAPGDKGRLRFAEDVAFQSPSGTSP